MTPCLSQPDRNRICEQCGEPFTPVEHYGAVTPMYPRLTSSWCSGCWATIRERLEVVGLLPVIGRAIPALRAEEVSG